MNGAGYGWSDLGWDRDWDGDRKVHKALMRVGNGRLDIVTCQGLGIALGSDFEP